MSEEITKALQDVPVVSDEQIEREYERVMGQHLRPQDRAGVLKVCRAILALRPAVEPMTPLHLASVYAVIDSMGWDLDDQEKDDMVDLVRATEKRHGITTKAEDAHQPTKEAGKAP